MGILSNDHQLVGGKQYFEDDVQLAVTPKGIRKDIYTPAADETISANKSGAIVILNDNIDIKLPTPELGLNYKFIKNANASAASTIVSTKDGSQVANLLTGTIKDDNDGHLATSNVDTITFLASATEGDFVDVRCVGTTGGGTAATATLTIEDGDDSTAGKLAEASTLTLISTDGTEKIYVLTDTGNGGVATGTVIAADSDIGSDTAENLGVAVGSIAVGVNPGTTEQHEFLTQLQTAINGATGHNGKIIASNVSGTSSGAQSMLLTQAVAGIGGNTVTTQTGMTAMDGSPDFDQTVSGVWQFNGFCDGDGKITAT